MPRPDHVHHLFSLLPTSNALMQRSLWDACRPRTPIFGLRFRSGGKSKKGAIPPSSHNRKQKALFKQWGGQGYKPKIIPDLPIFKSPTQTSSEFELAAAKWWRNSVSKERLVSFGAPVDDATKLLETFGKDVEAGFFDEEAKHSEYQLEKLSGANSIQADMVLSHVFFRWLKARGQTQLGKAHEDTVHGLLHLSRAASIPFPAEIFERARRMRRKIIMHVGPTNSGKTYHALRALSAAKSGVYAGPLRLLAHEIWERMNLGQIAPLGASEEEIAEARKIKPSVDHPFARKCNMLTGEEVKIVEEGAPLSSCTVEMLSLVIHRDIAVVDEIQMISDSSRGNAWTRAVLGLCADEIHLCGEDTAVPLVEELLKETGDELIVRRYERLTPLTVEKQSLDGDVSRIEKGDCIVTFSRSSIFATKALIERETPMRCAVVYGHLPPEIRSQQAALFNAGDADYDVLIGSDAIGMGLNLKIRRIIFQSVHKFDGHRETVLSVSQMKQIAGRAGRFGMHDSPGGFVTTLRKEDLPILTRTLPLPNTPVRHARLNATLAQLTRIVACLPENVSTETLFNAVSYTGRFSPHILPAVYQHLPLISPFLDTHDLSLADRLLLLEAPFPWRDVSAMDAINRLIHQYNVDSHIDFELYVQEMGFLIKLLDAECAMKLGTKCNGDTFNPSRELAGLENFHKILVLYIWLSYRNPVAFDAFDMAVGLKTRVEQALHWCLEEMTYQTGGQRPDSFGHKEGIAYTQRKSRNLAIESKQADEVKQPHQV
ncbi:ATP-dependent RNA helicase [Mycena indigotica]|uniref:RNA helicase n=1 Tax=Mycena indigotica TaxID=2126181 RepID=A0A8H6WFQ2_9AGAR|nr:ATP-dependent RNA helicase [Mycena indigotica]KAF7314986.1 ATP-dependent RNA helicase [Mycena indigotica]